MSQQKFELDRRVIFFFFFLNWGTDNSRQRSVENLRRCTFKNIISYPSIHSLSIYCEWPVCMRFCPKCPLTTYVAKWAPKHKCVTVSLFRYSKDRQKRIWVFSFWYIFLFLHLTPPPSMQNYYRWSRRDSILVGTWMAPQSCYILPSGNCEYVRLHGKGVLRSQMELFAT